MKFGATLVNNCFIPLDPIQAEEIETNLLNNKEYIIDVLENRNAGNHRRYFAFIKIAFDMQSHFENRELMRKYLQMRAGHYDSMLTPKGETMYIPKSISWDKLKEAEFRQLFKEVIGAYLAFYNKFVGTMSEDEFYTIIEFD